jgi:VWFA-related protein
MAEIPGVRRDSRKHPFRHHTASRWLALLLSLSLASPLPGQTPQTPDSVPGLSIRVSSRLVLVDVVVTDKHGQPVLGLQSADFSLTEKGKPQKISVFTSPNQAAKPAGPTLAPGVYSNRPEYRAPGGPPTVIVLDTANTPLTDQTNSRTQMLKWVVDEYRPGDRVAIFALTSKLVALSDFTDDPQVLITALRQYVAQKSPQTRTPATPDVPAPITGKGVAESYARVVSELGSMHEADLQRVATNRANVTVAAMRALVRILGGIPGRKNIIWLTAGFPFSLVPQQATGSDTPPSHWNNEPEVAVTGVNDLPADLGDAQLAAAAGSGVFQAGLDPGQQRLYANKVRDIAAQFASSQVAIYPVDVTGLDPSLGHESFDRQQTMKEIARETGGQAFVNQNDLHRGVELAFADQAASYTIGYYPENKKWDGGYRVISVKVDREGVEVRHRRGYFAVDPATENEKMFAQDLADAIQDKISATQIGFYAKVSAIEKDKTRIDFMVDGDSISAEDTGKGKRLNLNFEVAIFAPTGKQVGSRVMQVDKVLPLETYQQIVQQGLSVHLEVDTPPGKNLAWLAVRDNHNGYIGTLQAPIGQ